MEGVDYDETYAPIARMESIRVLLALACHLKFKLYQMDVKTAFLNGFLKEDVYVAQPKGFIDPHFLDHVLYLKKAFFGLKQAPRAWYDWLTQYLVSHGFTRGQADQTLLHLFKRIFSKFLILLNQFVGFIELSNQIILLTSKLAQILMKLHKLFLQEFDI